VNLAYQVSDDTAATAKTLQGLDLSITQLDISGVTATGVHLAKAAATATGAAPLDAGLLIENLDTDADAGGADTAANLTDAIRIQATTDGTIVDALDVSDAEITNALNLGANNLVTSLTTISSAELDRLDGKDAALVDGNDADVILEAHLKAVDAAVDEECLTYETTTGDFEWQSCAAGAGDLSDVLAGTGIAVTNPGGPQPSVALSYANTLAGNPALAASEATFASTGLLFEGATADTIESLLTVADPATSDKTWTLPNTTGTLVTTGDTGSVDTTMLLDGTVASGDIAVDTIAAVDIAAGAVGTSEIADGTVATADLAANAVTTAEIAADTIAAADIAADAVGASELASTTVAAGSYTFTALTVDADGRLTAASSGTDDDTAETDAKVADNITIAASGKSHSFTLGAANTVLIDGATTASTTTGGVLDLDVTSTTDLNEAVNLAYQVSDDTAATAKTLQ
ncbi:MAG: collagen triple helix repeat-containing protein, partial [Acidimicrobiaceae bacterium]